MTRGSQVLILGDCSGKIVLNFQKCLVFIFKQPSPTKRDPSLKSSVEAGQLYIVEYTFEKEDDAEISVKEGTVVNVQRKHDKDGNTEWWLVETLSGRGYVPALYLSPVGTELEGHREEVERRTEDESANAPTPEQGRYDIQPSSQETKSCSELKTSNNNKGDKLTQNGSTSDYEPPVTPQSRSDRVSNIATVSKEDKRPDLLFRTIYDFEASETGECSVTEGEIVRLMKMGDENGNLEWFQIECHGRAGYVPANYLEPVNNALS